MQTLTSRTARIHRGLIYRSRGFERLYQTKVTDGDRIVYGRGPTREVSEQSAQRNWDAKFGRESES
jgi:hypothetical protein